MSGGRSPRQTKPALPRSEPPILAFLCLGFSTAWANCPHPEHPWFSGGRGGASSTGRGMELWFRISCRFVWCVLPLRKRRGGELYMCVEAISVWNRKLAPESNRSKLDATKLSTGRSKAGGAERGELSSLEALSFLFARYSVGSSQSHQT